MRTRKLQNRNDERQVALVVASMHLGIEITPIFNLQKIGSNKGRLQLILGERQMLCLASNTARTQTGSNGNVDVGGQDNNNNFAG